MDNESCCIRFLESLYRQISTKPLDSHHLTVSIFSIIIEIHSLDKGNKKKCIKKNVICFVLLLKSLKCWWLFDPDHILMREGQDFLSKKVHSVKSQTSFRFQIHNIEHIRIGLSSLSRLILPWLVTLSRHSCISTKLKGKTSSLICLPLYPTFVPTVSDILYPSVFDHNLFVHHFW